MLYFHFMKQIKNFAVIRGFANIQDGSITFEDTDKKGLKINRANPILHPTIECEVRADVNFQTGTLEFKVKLSNPDCACFAVFNTLGTDKVSVGTLDGRQQFMIYQNQSQDYFGNITNYDLNNPLLIKIVVVGSLLSLYVNDIFMGQSNCSLRNEPISFILRGGEITIYNICYEYKKPRVFAVMQFSDEYNTLYKDVIKPICEENDLDCVRGDDFYTTTPILQDIIDNINDSSLIIAEITPDNPNVFYEIGYAHALNKPTILLCDRKKDKLPFDVSGFRTLFYDNSIGGKKKVEDDLKKYIKSIFKK